MSTKKWISLMLFLSVSTSLSAQNSPPYTFLNNMVQPAPNAAALGKYAEYPVSFYTGVPEIGVPLYNLKDGGISLPVSLSYHASGIRVSEVATWVGLGWVLNAGGMITRTVMGAPDEGGYYASYGLSTLPVVPYPSGGTVVDPSNFSVDIAPKIANVTIDGEPDLFTFNFNGHAGKFVFDEKRAAHTFEDDNLRIQVNDSGFNSFTITTADGIKYVFGENSIHEQTNPISSSGTTDPHSSAPSSWYLTSVINPNTKDTVTLQYTPEVYSYWDLGGETKLTMQPAQNSPACDNSNIIPNMIQTKISGWRLTSIISNNYSVKFIAKTLRTDLSAVYGSGMTAYMLDSVKVYNNNNNQCIKQWALSHSYFNSNTNTTGAVATLITQGSGDNTDIQRLKLLSVKEYSGDGSIQNLPYVFSYNETLQLPRRLSYDQDEWGYSNNYAGNANPYFTPIVYDGLCTTGQSPVGATRTSKWPDMASFTLSSIQDPLGATTSFIFEGNTAYNTLPASNGLVGGLRINTITVTDNVTGATQTKSYNYNNGSNSTGVLFSTPVHLLRLNNEYYWNLTLGHGYIGPSSNSQDPLGIIKQSQSVVPLQDPHGNHIGYTSVKETFGGSGQGGYIVRQYSNLLPLTPQNSKLDFSNYTAQAYMYGAYGLYGNGHFNDTTAYPAVKPQNLQYANNLNSTYPYAPTLPDYSRGQLASEYTYDASGKLVASIDNTYTLSLHDNALIRGVKCYTSSTGAGMSTIAWYALTYYKYHTGISHLTSTVKKTYNGASYVTETTNHNYESPYHTLETSSTMTSSQGDSYINRTYYSWDYANSATADNIFGKMKARNMLEPVNGSSWKNGNLVDAKITKYQDFAATAPDTLIYPGTVYATETVNPLTAAQANQTTTWGGQLSTLLPNTTYYKAKVAFGYDSYNGKLINQQLTGNINHAVAWDNQLSLPIAVVDNAYNQSHTIVVANAAAASVTLPSTGGTTHYTASFTATGTGRPTISIGFSGNPNSGGNPKAIVSCQITGTTATGASYDSGVQLLCISAGTSTCSYPSSTQLTGSLPPGQYTFTAYYSTTPTLYCNVVASTSYYLPATYSSSGSQQFYYQGFEQSLPINGVTNAGTAHTGSNFYNGSYMVSFTPPSDGRTYKISYWYLNGSTWTLMPEQTYTGNPFFLTGGTAYDDIRVYPSDAQMTTYTYDASGNITSSIDPKGLTTYYEYDAMQRLSNIKDKDGNIVKHIDYHYHGQ